MLFERQNLKRNLKLKYIFINTTTWIRIIIKLWCTNLNFKYKVGMTDEGKVLTSVYWKI